MPDLYWQTILYAAGGSFMCLESYDSIHQQIRDSRLSSTDDTMSFAAPIELTVAAEGNVPMRGLFNPMSISSVLEIVPSKRMRVEEAEEA